MNGSSITYDKHILVEDNRLLQVGALVYRINENAQLQFLLITSRGTGRWIIPKGWPMPGKSLSQAALREAYEESGVRGIVETSAVGRYRYRKFDMPDGENGRFCVDVFAVLYSHQEKKWPERGQRIYEWIEPEEAAKRVAEPQLKNLLLHYQPH